MFVIGGKGNNKGKAELGTGCERLQKDAIFAADCCPDVLWSYNLHSGRWEYISPSVAGLAGYSAEEAGNLSPQELLTTEAKRYLTAEGEKRLELFWSDQKNTCAYRDIIDLVCRDGSILRCEVTSRCVLNAAGEPTLTGVARTAGESTETDRMPRLSGERYREILDSIEEGYYECDLNGKLTFFNSACCRMFGYSAEEFAGISYKELYSDPKTVYHRFNQVYQTGLPDGGFTMEMLRKDGSLIYTEISISPLRDKKGAISGFRGVARDITERVNFLQQLEYFSMHDQLTGLYNRNYFEEELRRLSKSRDYPITMISVDVNGLKMINDTMGHDQGDRLLKAAAEVLTRSLRGSDVLARIGGDEFAAILLHAGDKIAEKVLERIKSNVRFYNEQFSDLYLSLSMGAATAESSGTSFTELFKQADDLMYRDKFSPSSSARNKIVKSLLSALADRDYIADGHGKRLAQLSRRVGDQIKLTPRQQANLALLAQVHDLGKVGIPDKILFKQGPLDEKEWQIIRQHPEKGHRIALSSNYLSGVAGLILKHHERWDGSGYPLGLKGREIPVECRVLAIVDAYDVMTNVRPYSGVKTIDEALEELARCAGTQFDPELVQVFIELVRNA